MYTKNPKHSFTFWQESVDGVAEEAILIERYSDVIIIRQGADQVNLSIDSIHEFLKGIKIAKNTDPLS